MVHGFSLVLFPFVQSSWPAIVDELLKSKVCDILFPLLVSLVLLNCPFLISRRERAALNFFFLRDLMTLVLPVLKTRGIDRLFLFKSVKFFVDLLLFSNLKLPLINELC